MHHEESARVLDPQTSEVKGVESSDASQQKDIEANAATSKPQVSEAVEAPECRPKAAGAKPASSRTHHEEAGSGSQAKGSESLRVSEHEDAKAPESKPQASEAKPPSSRAHYEEATNVSEPQVSQAKGLLEVKATEATGLESLKVSEQEAAKAPESTPRASEAKPPSSSAHHEEATGVSEPHASPAKCLWEPKATEAKGSESWKVSGQSDTGASAPESRPKAAASSRVQHSEPASTSEAKGEESSKASEQKDAAARAAETLPGRPRRRGWDVMPPGAGAGAGRPKTVRTSGAISRKTSISSWSTLTALAVASTCSLLIIRYMRMSWPWALRKALMNSS
mmetsp:Transcript_7209/g.18457  ORF Transcript_7209/g.18457 Transcript_7209/m.18457 type:complete len:338 (-) Transcript_7209:136-1149(-)